MATQASRMSTDRPPDVPVSDDVLSSAIGDIIDQLGYWLAAVRGESRLAAIDRIIIDAEHARDLFG